MDTGSIINTINKLCYKADEVNIDKLGLRVLDMYKEGNK